MWKTHIAFGVLCGLLVLGIYETNLWIFFPIVIFGSLLPDIDEPHSKLSKHLPILRWVIAMFVSHRGIFHSLFIAIGLPALIWMFFGLVYAMPLFIGYMSHLFIDGMTKGGINFLHPVSQLRLKGFVETGSILESLIFFGLSLGVVLMLI